MPQAVDDSTVYNLSLRLTGQLGQRNKLTAYVDRSLRETNSTNQAQAAYSPSDTNYYFGQTKWTSTFSNKLLLGRRLRGDELLPDAGLRIGSAAGSSAARRSGSHRRGTKTS